MACYVGVPTDLAHDPCGFVLENLVSSNGRIPLPGRGALISRESNRCSPREYVMVVATVVRAGKCRSRLITDCTEYGARISGASRQTAAGSCVADRLLRGGATGKKSGLVIPHPEGHGQIRAYPVLILKEDARVPVADVRTRIARSNREQARAAAQLADSTGSESLL